MIAGDEPLGAIIGSDQTINHLVMVAGAIIALHGSDQTPERRSGEGTLRYPFLVAVFQDS